VVLSLLDKSLRDNCADFGAHERDILDPDLDRSVPVLPMIRTTAGPKDKPRLAGRLVNAFALRASGNDCQAAL
jgi:hypothetical protein